MDGSHTIKILLMENVNPDKSILKLLKDFSTKNRIELSAFDNENELCNYLKEYKSNKGAFVHELVLFHLENQLTNVIKIIDNIKNDPELKATPVIIITDSAEDKEVMEAYKCHLNCFITKPGDLNGFIQILDSFKQYWFNIVELP
jgi:DNA-binding response OmpR family regulator